MPALRSLLSVALLGLLAAACKEDPPPPSQEPDFAQLFAGEGATTLVRAEGEQVSDTLQSSIDRFDPRFDAYRSEVLHDLAKARLKEVSHALAGAAPIQSTLEILGPSFEGAGQLRPAGLETVFDDGTTKVLRPTSLATDRRSPSAIEGQLTALLRAEYLVDAQVIPKVKGQPFTAGELVAKIEEMVK